MSNKLKIIIVFVVISLIGAVLFFSSGKKQQEGVYAQYLPADTLLTMSFNNINKMVDEFDSSSLGQLFSKESMGRILSELDMAHQIQSYNQACDDLVEVVQHPAFRTVFGDDTTLAILKPDLQKLIENTPQEIERTVVAFATTAVSGAMDLFAQLLATENVSKEVVGGVALTKIQIDAGKNIYSLADSGLLVLSYNPETLVSIMAAHKGTSRLSDAPDFKEAEKNFATQPDTTVYSKTCIRDSYSNYSNILYVTVFEPYLLIFGEAAPLKLAEHQLSIDCYLKGS